MGEDLARHHVDDRLERIAEIEIQRHRITAQPAALAHVIRLHAAFS